MSDTMTELKSSSAYKKFLRETGAPPGGRTWEIFNDVWNAALASNDAQAGGGGDAVAMEKAAEFMVAARNATMFQDVRELVSTLTDSNAKCPGRHLEARRVLPLLDAFLGKGYTGRVVAFKRGAEALSDPQAECSPHEAWQPITSAPKTGRTLLLGYPNSLGKWRTTRGQWMSEAYIAENWEEPDDAEPGWYETSVEADDVPNCWPINPTHWIPLPDAPSTGDQS